MSSCARTLSFLIFWLATCSGRQSATAATPMKQSMLMVEAAMSSSAITVSSICCALCTGRKRTPYGRGRAVGPLTSVTRAPACRQAWASA